MSTGDIQEKILTALKKLGPSSPRVIADQVGIDPGKVSYALGRLLKAKTLKAAGTSNDRVYALPEQKLESHRKKKNNGKAKDKARAPQPPRTETPLFLPALTEGNGLVLVRAGEEPLIFNPQQTLAIAGLLLTHFEA